MTTPDFFRARLDQMSDLSQPLAVLAMRLPGAAIEAAISPKDLSVNNINGQMNLA